MIFDDFEKEYNKEERELLILRSNESIGAARSDGPWSARASFLAYVDVKTDELHNGEGCLVWPLTDEEEETNKYFQRFSNETIYHVKARELIDKTVPKDRVPSFYNRFYITEILEENVTCLPLEEILTEYRKLVKIEDNILGELILNKDYSFFYGKSTWLGKEISINLEVDKDSKATWTKAVKAMKQMFSEQDKWDKNMREFSANELISLANDWLEEEEGKNATAISEEDFSKRITIQSISMTSGGKFSVYFDDDDMFWGHVVMILGSLKQGIKSADIEG